MPFWDNVEKYYNKFTSSLYMFRAHVLIFRRSKLYYTVSGIITPIGVIHHTYRCDDTRGCIIQFWPPDDEHMCSKHVEAWSKLIIIFSASSWLILRNKYIEMHGQQNIKKKKNTKCVDFSVTFTFNALSFVRVRFDTGRVWLSPAGRGHERFLLSIFQVNLLKPTGYVMYHQFNIQQLYALPTLYLCFVFIWEQTATYAPYSINWLVFITEMKSVYSAARTGSLNKVVCDSF